MTEANTQILIVEDERLVFHDIKYMLNAFGYSIPEPIDTGEKAINAVKKSKPALVLMDIGLKGPMTGIEAARIIYSQYNVPVVYLTAFADEKMISQLAETQPYGYLLKPVVEQELKMVIEMAILKHKMEQELKESEERLREIFEQNADAIILLRQDTFDVIDLNSASLSIFQYSREELKTKFSSLFEDKQAYSQLRTAITDFYREEKKGFSQRLRLHRKDGMWIVCDIRINPIDLKNERVFYCVFRDITEQTRMEEEARILQARLIHANRMTAMGTLASGVAHEINNPNNYILSNTQMFQCIWEDTINALEEKMDAGRELNLGGLPLMEAKAVVPQLLKAVIEGSRRIKFIIDNLKDFSRPHNGSILESVSINKVIEFAISILSNQIKTYTDVFQFTPGKPIPSFKGNSRHLEQVFINLIQNALQALPRKHCGVKVVSRYQKEQNSIMVTIKDEGVGMNKNILDRITDPFFTTRQDIGGTGLGLYISYSIIKDHHGLLEFKSQPGKGTRVIVKIPVEPTSQTIGAS